MASWKSIPLAEVCQFINRGMSPAYLEAGGVAVLNQKCVRDHAVNFDLGRRHDAAAKKVTPERFVRAGDVLVNSTGTGTLGRVAQLRDDPPEPTTVDSHVTIVRPTPGLFHPEFFGYALVAIEEQIQEGGEGCGGQTELSRTKLAEGYRVSFPADQDEQRRIVAILDEAFEGIATAKAHAEKNLRNAREVFAQSREDILERSEGWLEVPLSELCEIRHGYAFEGEHFATQGEHVLLTPGSFFETGGFRDRGGKTKYFVGAIPPAFVLDEGDLLVAMTEQAAGLLGSPLLVPEDGRYLHNQRLGRVIGRDSTPWMNDFFFHVFNLRRVRAEIHASASGVKVRHTSPAKIGAVRVKFPPTSGEQSVVAAALRELAEDCHRLQALYTRKLAALDEFKQSLLHQAFSGAL
jgi:type I restriction enzyme S subunit